MVNMSGYDGVLKCPIFCSIYLTINLNLSFYRCSLLLNSVVRLLLKYLISLFPNC